MGYRHTFILCAALAGAGCTAEPGTQPPAGAPEAPDLGVVCASTSEAAAGADGLTAALAAASPGTCVLVGGGSYEASFTVPEGVKLVARPGESVELHGTGALPALVLRRGAAAVRLAIGVGSEVGLQVEGGPAELRELTIGGASVVGLLVDCGGEGCLEEAREVHVVGATLDGNGTGLWVRGGRVLVEDGSASDNEVEGLRIGYGVVASGGALVTLLRTEVSRNEGAGILVDGAGGTRALLTDVVVRDNPGRGIWAQGLEGPTSFDPVLPMLKIDGAATRIEGNAFVGIGASHSRGIHVSGVQVSGTVNRPVILDLGVSVEIGDGIGLFDGTGAVLLEGVELSGNERSQLLVDDGAEGIVLQDATVTASGDQLLAVVQRTTPTVEVPAAQLSTTAELPVDARPVPLPQ